MMLNHILSCLDERWYLVIINSKEGLNLHIKNCDDEIQVHRTITNHYLVKLDKIVEITIEDMINEMNEKASKK